MTERNGNTEETGTTPGLRTCTAQLQPDESSSAAQGEECGTQQPTPIADVQQTRGGGQIITYEKDGVGFIEIVPAPGYLQDRESPHGPYRTTPGSREMPEDDVQDALRRFNRNDWGEINAIDARRNRRNLETDLSIRGVYLHGKLIIERPPGEIPTAYTPEES